MAKTTVNLTDTVTNWVTKTNDLSNTIGDLANLNTTVDSDVVGAISVSTRCICLIKYSCSTIANRFRSCLSKKI